MANSFTNRIQAILFDLDNTLIATRKADLSACKQLFNILCNKYEVPYEIAEKICESFLLSFRKCPEHPSMDLDEWRLLLWERVLGEQYGKYTSEIYQQWLQLRFQFLQMSPEIQAMLQKLQQHYLIGLITNGPSMAQWEKINRLNLKSMFDIILVSGDLPWEKPHRKIFHEACHFLGVQPSRCLMVGDKLETDILGGINAELGGTVWIPLDMETLDETNKFHPDFTLQDVVGLSDLLPINCNSERLKFRTNRILKDSNYSYERRFLVPVPDLEDCNSNSSDGS